MALTPEEQADLEKFAGTIAGMVEDLHKRVERMEAAIENIAGAVDWLYKDYRKIHPKLDIPKGVKH